LGYILRPKAAEDLDRIIDFSIENFPMQARRTARELLDAFRRLCDMPTMGTPRNDILSGCRCWPVRAFIIVYRETDGGVEILRIAHGRQQIESLVSPEIV
jgi:toxin ParE1/3/4